jgi:restriction system protein
MIGVIIAFVVVCGLAWLVKTTIRDEKRLAEARESRKKVRRMRIEEIMRAHLSTLARKRRQLLLVDDYGIVRDVGWSKEVNYFLERVIKWSTLSVFDMIWARERLLELVELEQTKTCNENQCVDAMDPLEFESYCANLLLQAGWNARCTQASGDQGVDVVAEKGNWRVVLQCKLYSQPVGNFAVQEVEAGRVFYGAQWAVVASNATFTLSAQRLAASTGTLLLHYGELGTLEERIKNMSGGPRKLA